MCTGLGKLALLAQSITPCRDGILTERVQRHVDNHPVIVVLIERLCLLQRPPHQPPLAARANRVEDKERVVAQPLDRIRCLSIDEVGDIEAVPHDLGDAPSETNADKSPGGAATLELVENAPDDPDAGVGLDDGGDEGGADETEKDVEGFEDDGCLGEFEELA